MIFKLKIFFLCEQKITKNWSRTESFQFQKTEANHIMSTPLSQIMLANAIWLLGKNFHSYSLSGIGTITSLAEISWVQFCLEIVLLKILILQHFNVLSPGQPLKCYFTFTEKMKWRTNTTDPPHPPAPAVLTSGDAKLSAPKYLVELCRDLKSLLFSHFSVQHSRTDQNNAPWWHWPNQNCSGLSQKSCTEIDC